MKPIEVLGTFISATGLSILTVGACVVCFGVRIVSGKRLAKRTHEYVLGQGLYYWMALFRFWSLKVLYTVPHEGDDSQTLKGEGESQSPVQSQREMTSIPPPFVFDGPYVIVSNHASFLDHSLLSFLPITKNYLTKQKYFILPFFGWTQWLVGDIGVEVKSKDSREKCMKQCADNLLKYKTSIVIYPEGTRSKNAPALIPFKEGAFRLAKDCKIKLLPVVVKNTQIAMKNGFVTAPASMELIVGLPIQVDDINEAINQVTAWMNKELFETSAETKKTK